MKPAFNTAERSHRLTDPPPCRTRLMALDTQRAGRDGRAVAISGQLYAQRHCRHDCHEMTTAEQARVSTDPWYSHR